MNKERNFLQYFLLTLSMLFAIIIISVSCIKYYDACTELSVLKADLNESTARWQQINEEKLVIQRELKAAKNNLREANLTIEESNERAVVLLAEIETLEQEIQAMKNTNP